MKKITTMPMSNKKFCETTETTQVVKNITLEGTQTLRAERFTTTFNVIKELNPKTNKSIKLVSKTLLNKTVEQLSFSLVEVTPEQVAIYRKKGISSFVLKVDGKLFYSEIPKNMDFVSSKLLGPHKCAISGHVCHRLSAASDKEGGCKQVRNYSSYIERYPWITTGYETFNTKHDSFVVVNCLHYKKCAPRKRLSSTELNAAKLGLANFMWEDVTSLTQVNARKAKNKSNIGLY